MAETKRTILLEYDVDANKLIDENGKVIKSIKQLTDAYKQQREAAQKMGDVEGENSKIVLGSISHIRKQVSALKEQRDNTEVGSQEFENLNVRLREAEARLKAATTATVQNANAQEQAGQTTKELAKLQENQARSAGLAGAAAFELGRTISDLPFGLVAISNNVSQLGTLFAALVANAGSVKKALVLLKTQLIGPAGILIAFQAVVAAVTYFNQRASKASSETNRLTESLSEANVEIAKLRVFSEILSDNTSSIKQQEEALKELKTLGFDETTQSINEFVKAQERLIMVRALQRAAEEQLGELEKEKLTLINEGKQVLAEIQELQQTTGVEGAGGPLRAQLETINERLKEVNEQSEIARRTLGQRIREGLSLTPDDITSIDKFINQSTDAAFKLRQLLIEQELDALEDSEVNTLEQRRFLREKLFLLELERLEAQKQAELDAIKDPEAKAAIEDRYKTLADIAATTFRAEIGKLLEKPLDTKTLHKIKLLDLLDGPEQTEAQKWAEKEVEKVGKAVASELEKRVAETPALNGEGEGAFDFAKAFGMSKERLDATINLAKTAISSISEVLTAAAEREIAIEQNKTNALNDQLRTRLANEQLSANERDKINQQIARNEAKLVAKENEINKKRFEQEKASRISMAVIDTFSAATGVLADTKGGSFLRIAGMIAVITAGLANVAAISKQQFVGKALPNPRLSALGGAEGGATGPAFNVVGASGQNQLAEAIQGLRNDPLRAYVVSSDVTTAQELERKIVEGASI